nr:MAG TPA: hypothetical protein [Crassvirales sp.]
MHITLSTTNMNNRIAKNKSLTMKLRIALRAYRISMLSPNKKIVFSLRF